MQGFCVAGKDHSFLTISGARHVEAFFFNRRGAICSETEEVYEKFTNGQAGKIFMHAIRCAM